MPKIDTWATYTCVHQDNWGFYVSDADHEVVELKYFEKDGSSEKIIETITIPGREMVRAVAEALLAKADEYDRIAGKQHGQ